MIDKKLSVKDNIINFEPNQTDRIRSGKNSACSGMKRVLCLSKRGLCGKIVFNSIEKVQAMLPIPLWKAGLFACFGQILFSWPVWTRARSNHTQDDCRIGVVANGFPVGTRHSLQGRLPFVAVAKMEFWHCFPQARGKHMLTYSSTANADWLLLAVLGRVESNRRTRKQLIRGPQNNRSKRT